jgi:hypothetical protein
MPQIRSSRAALFLIAVALVTGANLLPFQRSRAADPAAEPSLSLLEPEQNPKPTGARKPRSTTPPVKDLRLTDEQNSAEDQIEATLAKPIDVNFSEMPLEDALAALKEQHHLDLWIDRPALNAAEISLDDAVTLQLSGVRLESILNLLLEPRDLDWLIQDEVLKITTRNRAAALAEPRTFRIQSLLDDGHTVEELIDAIVKCVDPDSWSEAGGVGTISHSGGVLICRQSQRVQIAIAVLLMELEDLAEAQREDERAATPVITLQVYRTFEYPADDLAKALMAIVAPESWKKDGADLRPVKGALLIRQTPAVHREIQSVMKKLTTPTAPAFGEGEGLPAPSESFEGKVFLPTRLKGAL